MSGLRSASLIVLVTFALVKDCHSVQSFKDEPSYTEVNPGETAELRCVINSIGGSCGWQKDGLPVSIHTGKIEWAGRPEVGDCSLKVHNVDIAFDDGEWACQVAPSIWQAKDALSSKPAKLVVREPPKSFSIVEDKSKVEPGGQITVEEGRVKKVQCVSLKSNPPPEMKWYLGDRELPSVQENVTEANDTRRWKSTSTLEHSFSLSDKGKELTCRVYHLAYVSQGYQESSVSLDLMYKPRVKIVREADEILEEGRSTVSLTCEADGNPAPRVFWRKYGGNPRNPGQDPSDVKEYKTKQEFDPVTRQNSGTYVCQAENSVGLSDEVTSDVDVLYPPRILRVTPTGGATVGVHNTSVLTCSAEGNPLPKYQWLQKLSTQQVVKRGNEDKLIIENTSYNHQGEYVCVAINTIDTKKNAIQSEPVRMEVKGAPQILRHTVSEQVDHISGRDVRLEMEVCSDPQPSRTMWQYKDLTIVPGSDNGGNERYLAEQLVRSAEREDCYTARLVVRSVSPQDSDMYSLVVENLHGSDRFAIRLNVKDPVSMASVIAVVIALLVLFVLLVIVLLYAYKKQKLCFKDEAKLDKNGIDKNGDAEGRVVTNGYKQTNGNGVIHSPLPPDGMYHVSENGHGLMDHNGSATHLAATLTDKLWPENPTYQVYVPGYATNQPGHHVSMTHGVVPNVYGSQLSIRARSVSPNQHPATTPNGLPLEGGAEGGRPNGILYAELQFPVTSNYGSMKKKSRKHSEHSAVQRPVHDSANTTASTSVNSGEPSPSTNMMSSMNEGIDAAGASAATGYHPSAFTQPATAGNTSQMSMDYPDHRYVPDFVAISNRKTAV